MNRPPTSLNQLHQVIADWYVTFGRDLPWRKSNDPYKILVSEIMLQQTQVARVIPKYEAFLNAFPTLPLLAEASVSDVIKIWSGMGYNNRAVRLHKLARFVVNELNNQLPCTAEELIKLPGVGPYTAAAIACFAFGSSDPVLDTNIYRVLSRIFHGTTPPSKKVINILAAEVIPARSTVSASHWSQALMDIGSSFCSIRRPACRECPAKSYCSAAPDLENPKDLSLAAKSSPSIPKQSKFIGSARYYRGKIIDILIGAGDQGSRVENLYVLLGYPAINIPQLLNGLESDGLIKQVNGFVYLP